RPADQCLSADRALPCRGCQHTQRDRPAAGAAGDPERDAGGVDRHQAPHPAPSSTAQAGAAARHAAGGLSGAGVSGVKPPSPRQLSDAYAVLLQAREKLLAIEPDIAEDPRLFGDMLEGEGGDAMGTIDRLIRSSIEAEDMAAQAHVRATEIAEREARYKRRNKALRDTAFALMQALDL